MAAKIKIENVKAKVLPILEKYDVKRASFFGSLVKKRLKKESDIDILVELPAQLSLLDFIGLKHELEDSIGRKVDLVEYETIKKPLEKSILAEQLRIL